MKFRHTIAYAIRGLTVGSDELEVLKDPRTNLRVVLTSFPAPYLDEIDRRAALGGLMLGGVVGQATNGSLLGRVDAAMAVSKEGRERKFGKGPFLIFQRVGEVQHFAPTHSRELPEFVTCFDAVDHEALNGITDYEVSSIISGLALASSDFLGAACVAGGFVFIREDDKPVYSYTFTMGTAEAYVSRPAPPAVATEVQGWYGKLMADRSLERVIRLLVGSWEAREHRLRSFFAAWNALEILINKTFPEYGQKILGELAAASSSEARRDYIARIRDVMKNKYRLVDKFAAISSTLAPAEADADVREFTKVKKQRDELLHGKDIDERSLNVAMAQQLVRKYLRLHLT